MRHLIETASKLTEATQEQLNQMRQYIQTLTQAIETYPDLASEIEPRLQKLRAFVQTDANTRTQGDPNDPRNQAAPQPTGTPSSRLDTKGATPARAGQPSSRLDTKGATPARAGQPSSRLDTKGATPQTPLSTGPTTRGGRRGATIADPDANDPRAGNTDSGFRGTQTQPQSTGPTTRGGRRGATPANPDANDPRAGNTDSGFRGTQTQPQSTGPTTRGGRRGATPIKVTTQDQANSILQNPNATPAEIKAAREFYGAKTPNESIENIGNNTMNEEINISGSAEDLIRLMQLAGADGAKTVDSDDISSHVHSEPETPCGSKPEPDMGDMVRMMTTTEEEGPMGDEYDDEPSAPDETYMNDVSASIPHGDDLHKKKRSYPATAGGDNPMNTEDADLEEQIKSQLRAALEARK